MGLIADAVIHAYNLSPENRAHGATVDEYEVIRGGIVGMHQLWSDPAYVCPPDAYVATWDAESLTSVVFYESETDLAVYHDVALYPVLKDGGTPLAVGAEMARALPGRVLLYGGVDATAPAPAALERMDQLAEEFGVAGFKFYPVTGLYDENGKADGVLLDDVERMYPLLRHADELGIRHIAMHKAVPFRREPSHPYLNVNDVDPAAVAFPNLTFEVVHSGMAFLEETAYQLGRHPNVYANLEISMNLIVRYPRRFARILGTLMALGGPHKILYATGCMLTHTQPIIEAFRRFEMPTDLIEDEGFFPVDDVVKDMILGGNLLALHGIDETELRSRIDGDDVAKTRCRGFAAAVVAVTRVMISASDITDRLRTIEDPCSVSHGTPTDIVSFGLIDEVRGGERPFVRLRLTEPTCLYRLWFHRQVRAAVGIDLEVDFTAADDFWEPVVFSPKVERAQRAEDRSPKTRAQFSSRRAYVARTGEER